MASTRHVSTPAHRSAARPAAPQASNLADLLDRVLDKGLVIAGDIQINIAHVELLSLKLRLLVASVDTAREMGIDWWEHDHFLSGQPKHVRPGDDDEASSQPALEQQNRELSERLDRIEELLARNLGGAAEPS